MSEAAWTTLVAGLGILISAAALVVAILARGHARDSANEAKRANELAEQANDRTARAEKIATAPSNIDWDPQWLDEASVLSVTQTGTDTARDVVLTIDALDEMKRLPRREEHLPTVEGGTPIGSNLKSWVDEADREWRVNSPDLIVPSGLAVRVAVTWRDEHDVRHARTWDRIDC